MIEMTKKQPRNGGGREDERKPGSIRCKKDLQHSARWLAARKGVSVEKLIEMSPLRQWLLTQERIEKDKLDKQIDQFGDGSDD